MIILTRNGVETLTDKEISMVKKRLKSLKQKLTNLVEEVETTIFEQNFSKNNLDKINRKITNISNN